MVKPNESSSALITPTSLIKDAHLFLCSRAAHDAHRLRNPYRGKRSVFFFLFSALRESVWIKVSRRFTPAHNDLLLALINGCHSVPEPIGADCYDLSG